ncbi:MAG: hydroxyphenylacetyl-CoA thioesterase PaaI [Magnetovibrio sp.]|nr:hydroxyphenylacetyl-CoA thioesterase PaaI [Magnetovibrio sp.]
MMSQDYDQDKLAQAVADGIYARDNTAKAMGIEILEAKATSTIGRMTVREDMLNFHGTCHGGVLYALAGGVLAYAINADNRAAVAQAGTINYTRPAHPGEVLTATAQMVNQAGRSGIYDVVITNEKQQTVALFRGQSSKIKGESIAGLNAKFGIEDQ